MLLSMWMLLSLQIASAWAMTIIKPDLGYEWDLQAGPLEFTWTVDSYDPIGYYLDLCNDHDLPSECMRLTKVGPFRTADGVSRITVDPSLV